MPKLSYSEKLKDPRWQRRRLELLDAAGWTCEHCGAKKKTLHVHHGHYQRDLEPWEYPDQVMHVLCAECHEKIECLKSEIYRMLGSFSLYDLEGAHRQVLDWEQEIYDRALHEDFNQAHK